MRKKTSLIAGCLAVLLVGYCVYAAIRPLPLISGKTEALSMTTAFGSPISWPNGAQAAVGAIGYGVVGSTSNEKAVPTASVAKVVTAMAILKQKPIAKGQQGPTITMGPEDVRLYKEFAAKDGSLVPVEVGEEITEYQALQAILLPSANNMAVSMTRWAFGSDEAYINFANDYVSSLGMYHTHIAGASGFEPETVSTPSDLVKLGEFAMQHPILAEIVNQTQATIPVAGTIRNVNGMLGQGGYIGIKTGNSDEAGGCYLFAVKKDFAYGQSVIIVGAILGATDLFTAIKASEPLIESASKQFEAVKVLSKGQKVGSYQTPWGDATDVITSDDIFQVVQKGSSVKYSLQLKDRSIDDKSLDAGSIVVGQNSAVRSVPVVLMSPLKPPSFTQRLTINYKQ